MQIKKVVIILLFLYIFRSYSQTIFLPHGFNQETILEYITAKKTEHAIEFAFDIHKVLIHKKPKAQWQVFFQYPHKSYFLRCLLDLSLLFNLGSMVLQLLLNHLPWVSIYREVTSEQLIYTLRHAQQEKLAELFTTIVNTQQVDPKMMQLIIKLKTSGYHLRVASNIGTQTYIKLKPMLEESQENIFHYFQKDEQGLEGKTVDYTISTAQKPDSLYYIEFQKTYNPHNNKLFIFVDDKLINVKNAVLHGFLGIHFKNADQLECDLKQLDLL